MREEYAFQAGQFNMIYLPGIGEVPISLSSDPDQIPHGTHHPLRGQCYAGHQPFADRRHRRHAGALRQAWPCVVSLATISYRHRWHRPGPLRPIIYHIISNRTDYGRVLLLYGARTPIDMLYTGEFEDWEANGIQIHQTVDRADDTWKGHVGVVPMMFYHLRLNPKKTTVLTCGPEIMIHFVIYEAMARRIPKEQIYVSMERNMKCGVGFCGHCQFGPTFVCKEGPVFSYAAIEPFFGVEDFLCKKIKRKNWRPSPNWRSSSSLRVMAANCPY